MMDLFGNSEPVAIEDCEWWFNGRIIQNQKDYRLPNWISFPDNGSNHIEVHRSKIDAIRYAINNPCLNPHSIASDYL